MTALDLCQAHYQVLLCFVELVMFKSCLSEGLYSDKCIDCKSCLDYISVKDDQLIFRCFECKKNYKKDFNKELIKRFADIYEFYNEGINKLFCY